MYESVWLRGLESVVSVLSPSNPLGSVCSHSPSRRAKLGSNNFGNSKIKDHVGLVVEWSKAHVSCVLLLGYQGFEPWFQRELESDW